MQRYFFSMRNRLNGKESIPNSRLTLIAAAALIWQLLSTCQAEEDPYAALRELVKLTTRHVSLADCSLKAVADYDRYPSHLAVFREAWLNKDYSLAFYNQRQRQVFLYVILKRHAELMTEGLYSGNKNEAFNECFFEISVQSTDKFGQTHTYPAVSWSFSRSQADKTSWENIDPRNFQDIAIKYKIAAEMTDWISEEPSMASSKTSSEDAKTSSCDERFLRANAIFIRATTYCKKDYMDGRAGYYALAMTRQCADLGESALMSKGREAMEELDQVVRRRGKSFACLWVDEVEQAVLQTIQK